MNASHSLGESLDGLDVNVGVRFGQYSLMLGTFQTQTSDALTGP